MEFQIHITVKPLFDDWKNSFLNLCDKVNVKPVLIKLPNGKYPEQTMFTYLVKEDLLDKAKDKVNKICEFFIENKFEVIRKKIEISPEENYNYISECNYYEWHCKVVDTNLEHFQNICKDLNAYVSKNNLESGQRFITIRGYNREEFYKNTDKVRFVLLENSIIIVKEKFEYCIYDSLLELDDGWV